MTQSVRLRVAEALNHYKAQVAVAQLHPDVMHDLQLTAGDVIAIQGSQLTAARVWPLAPSRWSRNIIRMNGLLRRNAGVSLTDKVTVTPATIHDATLVQFAPVDMRLNVDHDFRNFVKTWLHELPLAQGNTVFLMVLGSAIPLHVVATEPSGIIRICDSSTVQVHGEPDPSSQQSSGVDEYLRDYEKQQARQRKVQPSYREHHRKQSTRKRRWRRPIPTERQPLIIISGLVALIGVFLAGFALHQLAFLILCSAVAAVVILVFYPLRCPRCGAYMFRGTHTCEVPSSLEPSVSVIGSRQQEYVFRWSRHIIKWLIAINGMLFFALLGYLVIQIIGFS
jgi:hypothetical protein